MQVLLIGGTGVLGRRALPELVAAGHDVAAVVRDAAAESRVRQAGATPVRLDVLDPVAVGRAARGMGAVVNIATAIPASPWPRRRWDDNDRLRREASAALSAAAIAAGARYVQESFAPAMADRGAAWADEGVPLDPIDQTHTVVDAEAAAAAVTAAGGTGVVLRFGLFYDAASGQTRQMLARARRGRLLLPGPADAYASMVHVADAATAVVAALEVPAGTYLVVEDEPMTRADHAAVLSDLLGRRVRPLPAGVGRLPVLRVLARSLRLSNARLRGASGWAPAHPSVREGWSRVLADLAAGRDAASHGDRPAPPRGVAGGR
jgi:nucleoside-diphosphate-sugar epimerase